MSALSAVTRRLPVPGGFERVAAITASLVGTQVVTAVLGLVYWTVATRRFSVSAVGLASAATSAMTLLASVGILGLGTLLISELAKVTIGQRRVLVRTAVTLATMVSGVLGLLAAIVVHLVPTGGLAPVSSTPLIALLFALGVAVTGTTMVLDQAVLVVGSGVLQLQRNAIASATKIAFLVGLSLAGYSGGMAIYLSWTLGTLVSLPLLVRRTRGGRALADPGPLVDWTTLHGLRRAAAGHHALNLALQAPMLLLSVVVTVVLSATENGYFATVRLVSGFVFMVPFAIAVGLFAAAGGSEREVLVRMRFTLPLGLAASLGADLLVWPFAGLVLRTFGSGYASAGVTALRVIVLAGLPIVVKDHYVALRRVQGRTGRAALVVLVGCVAEVAAAVVGARLDDITGLSAAWVVVLAVEAGCVAAPLLRESRAVDQGEVSAEAVLLMAGSNGSPVSGSTS